MPQIEPLTFTPRAMEMLEQTRPWARLISVLIWIAAGLMILGGVIGSVTMLIGVSTAAGPPGGATPFMVMQLILCSLYVVMASST